MPSTTGRRRLLVMTAPTRSPMGVMLISAPSVKNMMPTTIIAAPSRKHSRMLGDTGAMVKQSTSTMAAMGSTACSASSSFSRSLGSDCLRMMSTAFRLYPISTLSYKIYLQYTKQMPLRQPTKRQKSAKVLNCKKSAGVRSPAGPARPRWASGTPGYRHRGRWCRRRAEPSCRRPCSRPPSRPRPRLPPRCAHP